MYNRCTASTWPKLLIRIYHQGTVTRNQGHKTRQETKAAFLVLIRTGICWSLMEPLIERESERERCFRKLLDYFNANLQLILHSDKQVWVQWLDYANVKRGWGSGGGGVLKKPMVSLAVDFKAVRTGDGISALLNPTGGGWEVELHFINAPASLITDRGKEERREEDGRGEERGGEKMKWWIKEIIGFRWERVRRGEVVEEEEMQTNVVRMWMFVWR